MRNDKLAKLFFYVGCAGLPWLWGVHILYFIGKQRRAAVTTMAGEENPDRNNSTDDDHHHREDEDSRHDAAASGILSSESIAIMNDEGDDQVPVNPSDIELEEKKWIRREFVAMVFVLMAWITWIIVFQVLREYFPPGWLVRGEDEGEMTGW